MRLNKKELVKLDQEIPMLEEDKEGLLRGGFSLLENPSTDFAVEKVNNCNCSNNFICLDDNTTTPEDSTSTSNGEISAHSGASFSSMLF